MVVANWFYTCLDDSVRAILNYCPTGQQQQARIKRPKQCKIPKQAKSCFPKKFGSLTRTIEEISKPNCRQLENTLEAHCHVFQPERVYRIATQIRSMKQPETPKRTNFFKAIKRAKVKFAKNQRLKRARRMKRRQAQERAEIENLCHSTANGICEFLRGKSKCLPDYKQLRVAYTFYKWLKFKDSRKMSPMVKCDLLHICQQMAVFIDTKCQPYKQRPHHLPFEKSKKDPKTKSRHCIFNVSKFDLDYMQEEDEAELIYEEVSDDGSLFDDAHDLLVQDIFSLNSDDVFADVLKEIDDEEGGEDEDQNTDDDNDDVDDGDEGGLTTITEYPTEKQKSSRANQELDQGDDQDEYEMPSDVANETVRNQDTKTASAKDDVPSASDRTKAGAGDVVTITNTEEAEHYNVTMEVYGVFADVDEDLYEKEETYSASNLADDMAQPGYSEREDLTAADLTTDGVDDRSAAKIKMLKKTNGREIQEANEDIEEEEDEYKDEMARRNVQNVNFVVEDDDDAGIKNLTDQDYGATHKEQSQDGIDVNVNLLIESEEQMEEEDADEELGEYEDDDETKQHGGKPKKGLFLELEFEELIEESLEEEGAGQDHLYEEIEDQEAESEAFDAEEEIKEHHPENSSSYVAWCLYISWLNELAINIETYSSCLQKFRSILQEGRTDRIDVVRAILGNWIDYLSQSRVVDSNMTAYFRDKPMTWCPDCRFCTIDDFPTNHDIPHVLMAAINSTLIWRKMLQEAEIFCTILNEEDDDDERTSSDENDEDSESKRYEILDCATSSSSYDVIQCSSSARLDEC